MSAFGGKADMTVAEVRFRVVWTWAFAYVRL